MSLSLDIWFEIIQYFNYPEDKSSLCSLATTSHYLSDLALNRIWRNGKKAVDIVSIINSFAPSPRKLYLEYEEGVERDSEEASPTSGSDYIEVPGSWVLDKPLPRAARDRALKYLARIIQLVISHGDRPIWLILFTSLSTRKPLLPRLQHLETQGFIEHDIDYLIPFLYSPLKSLLIPTVPPQQVRTILNLAKANGCDLERFACDGPLCHLEILSFENLKSVRLLSFIEHSQPQKASTTIVHFLASLPSLRSFTCNLASFSRSMGADQLYHIGLQKIGIRAQAIELQDLFHRCTFPSVTVMKIRLLNGRIPSFEGLGSSCPNTCNLEIGILSANWEEYLLESKMLAPLLSLPMETFELHVRSHNFTPSDLHTFLKSWPGLRSFKIYSKTQFDPLPSLAVFSSYPRLEHFRLVPLPFCRLLREIAKSPPLIGAYVTAHGSRPCIRTLCFNDSNCCRRFPVVTMEEKRMCVEHMLLLFPSLEKFEFSGIIVHHPLFKKERAEFEEILLELTRKREGNLKAEK